MVTVVAAVVVVAALVCNRACLVLLICKTLTTQFKKEYALGCVIGQRPLWTASSPV